MTIQLSTVDLSALPNDFVIAAESDRVGLEVRDHDRLNRRNIGKHGDRARIEQIGRCQWLVARVLV